MVKQSNILLKEIYKALGNDYYLHIKYSDKLEMTWILFKNYTDKNIYFSADNKPIMSGDKNDLVKLYKYAKRHQKLKSEVILQFNLYISIIAIILQLINMFTIKLSYISAIISGLCLNIILTDFVIFYIMLKNQEVEKLERMEGVAKWMR